MNGKYFMIAASTLAIMTVTAIVTYLLTKHDLANQRRTMVSPTINSDVATPTSDAPEPGTESDIIKEVLLVRSVAQRYAAAITARDEPAAAEFTCAKTHGGMLWLEAAGRPVTVLRVVGIATEPADESFARVVILVADAPTSPLLLSKADGTWCVRP